MTPIGHMDFIGFRKLDPRATLIAHIIVVTKSSFA